MNLTRTSSSPIFGTSIISTANFSGPEYLVVLSEMSMLPQSASMPYRSAFIFSGTAWGSLFLGAAWPFIVILEQLIALNIYGNNTSWTAVFYTQSFDVFRHEGYLRRVNIWAAGFGLPSSSRLFQHSRHFFFGKACIFYQSQPRYHGQFSALV